MVFYSLLIACLVFPFAVFKHSHSDEPPYEHAPESAKRDCTVSIRSTRSTTMAAIILHLQDPFFGVSCELFDKLLSRMGFFLNLLVLSLTAVLDSVSDIIIIERLPRCTGHLGSLGTGQVARFSGLLYIT